MYARRGSWPNTSAPTKERLNKIEISLFCVHRSRSGCVWTVRCKELLALIWQRLAPRANSRFTLRPTKPNPLSSLSSPPLSQHSRQQRHSPNLQHRLSPSSNSISSSPSPTVRLNPTPRLSSTPSLNGIPHLKASHTLHSSQDHRLKLIHLQVCRDFKALVVPRHRQDPISRVQGLTHTPKKVPEQLQAQTSLEVQGFHTLVPCLSPAWLRLLPSLIWVAALRCTSPWHDITSRLGALVPLLSTDLRVRRLLLLRMAWPNCLVLGHHCLIRQVPW